MKSTWICLEVHRVFHGIESISYLGPQIWNMVPKKHAFKRETKKGSPKNYPGRLCKPYVQSVGFVKAY